jgi:preprotein translocase subunit SecA
MATIVGKALTTVFGSRNDRLIKRYRRMVADINAMEPKVQALTDEQIRDRTQELRSGLTTGKLKSADVLPEALAIVREAMDRHIGIRQIFNPDENFDPDKFDDETLALYDSVQRRMINEGLHWLAVPIPLQIYAAVRKLYPESRPPFRARCFDVQLMGGLVLYEGKIAEMATGEGKTFVAPLACFLRVLEGFRCHVITVNDYLVKRDASWIQPAFAQLGLSVGWLQQPMEPGGEERRAQYQADVTYGTNSEFGFDYLRDNMKKRVDEQVQGPLDFAIVDEVDSVLIDEARTPLIISGAARDDAAKYKAADAVARAVIAKNKAWDAVDKKCDTAKRAIKAAEGDADHATTKADKEAARARRAEAEKQLEAAEKEKEGITQYYEVELDRKTVHLTHEGIAAAQEAAGVGSFYVGDNMEWPHLMEQALRAHVVYERDKDYVVERGQRGEMEVIIVDEFTGRKMAGRQWSDGLHQAAEAKENVPIKQETQTLATITLQNFFKLYRALSGMTGTALTEAEEFHKIYKLDVVSIPTNRPLIRQDNEDRVYRSEKEKWTNILDEIKAVSDLGRPVLVGTTSVEKSEMLSNMLKRKYGIDHEVLNAKNHEREAQIIALAGQQHRNVHGELVGNVTVATNMAGRGTDIKPQPGTFYDVISTPHAKEDGGTYVVEQRTTGTRIEVPAPTAQQWKDGAEDPRVNLLQLRPGTKVVGGLHVIGTERHTARRIDNQLRGRSGRQGDPGSSRFYVSLQDDLMKMFAGEWTIKVLGFLGLEEGMAIEDKRISKGILNAQKKVEERNYLSRKNMLEYDDVMDAQRTHFYGTRQQVLEGRDVAGVIWGMIDDAISDAVDRFVTQDYVAATVAEWAATNFQVNIDPRDLRGRREIHDLERYIKAQARAEAETNLSATIGEFTGEDETDTKSWDTRSLSSWAMSRFGVNLSQAQIRRSTPQDLEDQLRAAAVEQINGRDASGLARYLEPLFAERELAGWARDKFGIELTAEEISDTAKRTRTGPAEAVRQLIEGRAREAYASREVEYPVNSVLTYTLGGEHGNPSTAPVEAIQFLVSWVRRKYGVEWTVEHVRDRSVRDLHDEMCAHQEELIRGGKLKADLDKIMAAGPSKAEQLAAFNARFGLNFPDLIFTPEKLPPSLRAIVGEPTKTTPTNAAGDAAAEMDPRTIFSNVAAALLRKELTELEQYVLIEIFDLAWMEHLYAMDMLKSGIGLQSFAEQDPRVLYKKEGFDYFRQMNAGIRDKVTDQIFRAKLMGQGEGQPRRRSNYRVLATSHAEDAGYGVSETVAAAATTESNGEQGPVATKQLVRDEAKVGRNDPCPCGSGKKYKKCHGAGAA